mgnify:CR=1 FL=1
MPEHPGVAVISALELERDNLTARLQKVDAAIQQGRGVWLSGPAADFAQGNVIPRFVTRLAEQHRITTPPGAPPDLRRIE